MATPIYRRKTNVPSIDEIYDKYVWQVYGFFAYRLGSRDGAEDLTQETFERATKALPRYDERRGSIPAWIMAIAQNLLIDHYRRNSRREHLRLEESDFDSRATTDGDTGGPFLGIDPDLAAAIDALSDRDREIVALRYGADLTGPEIAALKGLSLANVQQILSRSLRRMREVMEERRSLSER